MMECHAKPYEGKDKYLFFSYARKDAWVAFPLIERLASRGCRIWYDAGIHAGTQWPEVIAQHLQDCEACLIFMTPNAMASDNCGNELVFARENKKPIIPVRFQQTVLTLATKLMLGGTQWIEIGGVPTDADIESLLGIDAVRRCLGLPDRSFEIQDFANPPAEPQPAGKAEFINLLQQEKPEEIPADARESRRVNRENANPLENPQISTIEKPGPVTAVFPETQKPARRRRARYTAEPEEKPSFVSPKENEDATEPPQKDLWKTEDMNEKTVASVPEEENERTVTMEQIIPPTIVFLSDGRRYRGNQGVTVLGRSKKGTDIIIPDPERRVSGRHLKIVNIDGTQTVEDLNSTNGTWIDGSELKRGSWASVRSVCEASLAKTKLLLAFGNDAVSLWSAPSLLSLRCEETEETRYIWQGKMVLGRNEPWRNQVLKDHRVSHSHATISRTAAGWVIVDHSTNGTRLNGNRIPSNVETALTAGDIVEIGDNRFIVTILEMDRGGKA